MNGDMSETRTWQGFPHLDLDAYRAKERLRREVAAETRAKRARQERKVSRDPSKVTGIYFNKQYQKFHARKQLPGKKHHVGYYNTLEEAIEAQKNYIPRELPPRRVHETLPAPKSAPTSARDADWFREQSQLQLKAFALKY